MSSRGGEGRERDAAALALAAAHRDVGEDPEDPGLERRAALEPVDPAHHRDPGLLHDLLGDRARGHVGLRDPDHRRAVAVDQLGERRLVAVAESGDQVRVAARRPHRRLSAQGRRNSRAPTGTAPSSSRTSLRPARSSASPDSTGSNESWSSAIRRSAVATASTPRPTSAGAPCEARPGEGRSNARVASPCRSANPAWVRLPRA